MANLVSELNSLNFSNYIGGPLQAAVQAQNAASIAQVNFIKEVGFDSNNDLRYVDFTFKKVIPVEGALVEKSIKLSVPFLTMLTLPAIRIEELTIDFNAKLTASDSTTTDSEFSGSAEFGTNFRVVSFKASASYKKSTTSTSNVERTYNMAVHVRAVNDEMPAGLQRILDIMESSIKEAETAA